MQYHFTNLVFEGGGVKGVAYVGAMKELEDRGITVDTIQRVGGTSAGAINAVLFALGYDAQEMGDVLKKTNFNDFKDNGCVFKDSRRFLKKFGWNKGDAFKKWMGELIQAKTGNAKFTFKDLARAGQPHLYLVATNLSSQYAEVFSLETTPDMEIRDAVRMSMSIPLFFTAVKHRRTPKERSSIYVDGGVLMNFPIKIFDRLKYVSKENIETNTLFREYYEVLNEGMTETHTYVTATRDLSTPHTEERVVNKHVYNKETLGLRLDTKTEIETFSTDTLPPIVKRVTNFKRYVMALMKSVWHSQLNRHVHGDDWQRTVYIDTVDVNTTDFDISPEKQEELIESGAKGVRKYFEWYDNVSDTDERSCNHPDYK